MSQLHYSIVESSAQELLSRFPKWRDFFGGYEIDLAIAHAQGKIEQLDEIREGRYLVKVGNVLNLRCYQVNLASLVCECPAVELIGADAPCWHLLSVLIFAHAKFMWAEFETETAERERETRRTRAMEVTV